MDHRKKPTGLLLTHCTGPGRRRDENDQYIRGLQLWWIEPEKVPASAVEGNPPRLRLHDFPHTAFLDGMNEVDSLVVAGSLAYISAEGVKEIPWGRDTRQVPRDTKGEPIPGWLQIVSLPREPRPNHASSTPRPRRPGHRLRPNLHRVR